MSSRDRLRLAPGVPDLAALGADSVDALFEPERLATFARAEELPSRVGDRVLRLPLPGTPDANGRVHERPRGAGTGHVVVRRYRADPWAALRGRFRAPRSGSLAERDWNLACHLRSRGVATPDLVLVAARGRGLVARESLLVTRDVERLVPFDAWAGEGSEAPGTEEASEERALVLEAVAGALGRLERSGVVLPELEPRDVFVGRVRGGCGGAEVPAGVAAAGGLRRLPGVVLANLRGGRTSADRAVVTAAARRLRRELAEVLPAAERERLQVDAATSRG